MSNEKRYITAQELVGATGICLSSINRLKREGKIPYLQPGGRGSKLLFPADALDQVMIQPEPPSQADTPTGPKQLAGVKPAWQRLKTGG